MTLDTEILLQITQGSLLIATVFTVMFPVLFSFSPWYRTPLGRVIMLQALAFAIALTFTLAFQFWSPPAGIQLLINTFVFILIAVATASVTWMLWRLNYHDEAQKEEDHMKDNTRPFLTNRTYDALKFIALIALPALGSFYFALAGIWSLPNPDKVVGTIVVVDTLLGSLLGLSSKVYDQSDLKFDGDMLVIRSYDGSETTARMELNDAAGSLLEKDSVTFRVKDAGLADPDDDHDDFVNPPA